jgi:hypothetical protein
MKSERDKEGGYKKISVVNEPFSLLISLPGKKEV